MRSSILWSANSMAFASGTGWPTGPDLANLRKLGDEALRVDPDSAMVQGSGKVVHAV